ncbi:amino acid ABC transporter permease [Nesterenkonia muleiensis]|uniref:amino acid ABC transporter permease n=1 Tax=Nesterenkonia muleiensis TaxID=2282648 RepID=UPI000E7513C2|nr:amino acid ABC transporter permease [Nesterenkonia muleiensis]
MIWLTDVLAVIPISLFIWAVSLVLGAVVAVPTAGARMSQLRPVRILAAVYIEIFRGIPTLVWLFVIFFGLRTFGLSPTALVSAILTLGIASSAYIAETYRSGLSSVPIQQREATTALGLSPRLSLIKIVLPQAKPIIFAGLGSYAIHLLKETALTSLIGVVEMMTVANYLVERGANGLTVFFVTGVIYMLLCLPIAGAVRLLGRSRRQNRPAGPDSLTPLSTPTAPPECAAPWHGMRWHECNSSST